MEIIEQITVNEGLLSALFELIGTVNRSLVAQEPIMILIEFIILGAFGGFCASLLMNSRKGQVELPGGTNGHINFGFVSEICLGSGLALVLYAIPIMPSVSAYVAGTMAGPLLQIIGNTILKRFRGGFL